MFSKKTFIIAEAGVNHNGKIHLALRLINEAKRVGADAVKFQIFKTDNYIIKQAKLAKVQARNTTFLGKIQNALTGNKVSASAAKEKQKDAAAADEKTTLEGFFLEYIDCPNIKEVPVLFGCTLTLCASLNLFIPGLTII